MKSVSSSANAGISRCSYWNKAQRIPGQKPGDFSMARPGGKQAAGRRRGRCSLPSRRETGEKKSAYFPLIPAPAGLY